MKKLLVLMLLTTSMGFAINPKQAQVNKIILSESKKIELIQKKLSDDNVDCANVWRSTYSFCMDLGIRYETSVAIADFAAEACLKIKYGPATTLQG